VDKPEEGTYIELTEAVTLSFGLKHLTSFTKAAPLSTVVKLGMSLDLPIQVDYQIEDIGFVRYYLAPKIEDDEMGGGQADEDDL
jgi:proliferating cell nuclear antigen